MSASYEFTVCCSARMTESDLVKYRKAVEERYGWMLQWMGGMKHNKRIRGLAESAYLCQNCSANYAFKGQGICEICINAEYSATSQAQVVPSQFRRPTTMPSAVLQLRVEEEQKIAPEEDTSQRSGARPVSAEPVLKAVKGTVGKRTSCVVCQAHYTRDDSAYFCPGACRCHRCVIEGIAGELANCKYCHMMFPIEVSSLVNRGYKRCHVCGLVVGIEELEASAPCTICSRCVIIESERSWLGLKRAKGHCRYHPTNTIDIEKGYYTDLQQKTKFDKWACCPRATSDDMILDCGHYVCAVHQEHLKCCRTCQTPVD